MKSFFKHYLIRMGAVCADPYALGGLLLTALTSLMYWPGVVSPAMLESSVFSMDQGINDIFLMLLWIFIVPMLAGYLAGGRVAAWGKEALAMRAMPSLPVKPRTRILAETLVFLTFVFLVRLPSFIFGESVHHSFYLPGLMDAGAATREAFMERSLVGSCIMLPSIMLWVAPARSVHFYFMVRPMLLVAAYLAALYLGWMSSPLSCVIVGCGLGLVTIFLLGSEIKLPRLWNGRAASARAGYRACSNPESQLRRDFWARPLPALALLLLSQSILIALEYLGVFPELAFYFCSCLVFGFMFSVVALRPLGFYPGQAETEGTSTRAAQVLSNHAPWNYLPVRREGVIRGIFLHGWITGAFIWTGVIATNLVSSRLNSGEWILRDMDGDHAAKYLMPHVALIPCLAGGLTSMTAGAGFRAMVSVAAAISILGGNVALLIMKAPPVIHYGLIILASLVGCLPALRYLRRPAPAPETGG